MGGAASVEKKRQKPQQLRQQQHEQQRQQFDKAQQSEQLVDAFLTQQMQAVAVKAPPAELSKQEGSTRRLQHKNSIEALAWQHQSRQTTKYISQEVFNASFRRPRGDVQAAAAEHQQQQQQQEEEDLDKTVEFVKPQLPAVHRQALKPKLPKLSLHLANSVDDEDWIKVDDDADMVGETPRVERQSLSVHSQSTWESYRLTQSGTIFVRGFNEGIGQTGIRTDRPDGNVQQGMPMQERLVLLCKLGQGATGIVYKAFDLQELRLVALKSIPVHDRSKRRQMSRELCALYDGLWRPEKQLSTTDAKGRDNIVKFYDAFSNVEEAAVALMVEYLDGGSLQDIVDDGGCPDEDVLASISQQALLGLAFLHNDCQLHRDLKPANMLINRRGEVKIADLGIARQVGGDFPEKSVELLSPDDKGLDRAHTFVGTVTYMSPERIDGRPYSFPSDIWSFGLSILTCALGRLPIDSSGGFWSILQCVRDDEGPLVPIDGPWSEEFREFIQQTLQKDPEKRPTCTQLLQHPFLKKATGLQPALAVDATASQQNGNGHDLGRADSSDEEMEQTADARLVEDIEALLTAVAEHLDELRSRATNSRPKSARHALDASKDWRLGSTADSLEMLLFGAASKAVRASVAAATNETAVAVQQQQAAVRLEQLAQQLAVPVGMLVGRCQKFIKRLRDSGDQSQAQAE